MRKSNERLRHQLEVQSIQIEEFLSRHEVPAEVAGGTVRSRWVSFDLNTQISAGLDKLRGLGNELASTLGVSDISITKNDDRLQIAVKQADNHAVDLLDLIDALPEVMAMTATLGLDGEDRPVLLNLLADDIVNILVAGGPEAGKTALLRTFALSLALQNRQSQIQMAMLDVPTNNNGNNCRPSLYPLNYLPHMMFSVVETLREAVEALNFLVTEVDYRIKQEIISPLLVLIIDDADELVEMGGQPIIEPLTYLLEEGMNAGLRIVLGASNPHMGGIRPLLKNTTPVRLVGQVDDASLARAISGVPDSQAEYLMGQGDFMAISNGVLLPFQAAFITDYDLHLILDKLHRQSQQVMVAQPMTVRPTLNPPDEEEEEQPQHFEFNSRKRQASLNASSSPKQNRKTARVIEATTYPPIHQWNQNQTEQFIEDAVWEEIDEDEDDWEEEAVEQSVIEIWGGYQDLSEDGDADDDWADDDDEDEEAEKQIQVFSKPRQLDSSRNIISSTTDDEIAFDWD